jgi:hypothetical protein
MRAPLKEQVITLDPGLGSALNHHYDNLEYHFLVDN